VTSPTAPLLKSGRMKFVVAFLAGVIAMPLVTLWMALHGRLSVDAISAPPRWETAIGQAGLQKSLARRAKGLRSPPLSDEADLLAGMRTYRNDCAGCHGDVGQMRSGAGLYPRIPQFVQHPPKLEAQEMFIAVKYGIRYSGMGAWDKEITDTEIWQAVTFLSRLGSLPAGVDEAWRAKENQQ